jgi:Na+-driven multidrug efflux pump
MVFKMWLLILGYAAVITTALWYVFKSKGVDYCLNYLSVILWGATVMFFIDSLYNYLNGEGFIEVSIDAIVLGFSLLLIALVIWLIILLIKDPRKVFHNA